MGEQPHNRIDAADAQRIVATPSQWQDMAILTDQIFAAYQGLKAATNDKNFNSKAIIPAYDIYDANMACHSQAMFVLQARHHWIVERELDAQFLEKNGKALSKVYEAVGNHYIPLIATLQHKLPDWPQGDGQTGIEPERRAQIDALCSQTVQSGSALCAMAQRAGLIPMQTRQI